MIDALDYLCFVDCGLAGESCRCYRIKSEFNHLFGPQDFPAELNKLRERAEKAEAALAEGLPTYRLTWIAGARPPAHPDPMTGNLTFRSEEAAWIFFRSLSPDARLVSLTKSITIDCGEVLPPADLAAALDPKGDAYE